MSYSLKELEPGYKGKFVIQEHSAEKAGDHWDIRLEFPVDSVHKSLKHYEDKRNPETNEPWGKFPDKGGSVFRSFVDKKMEFPTKSDKIYLVETEDHPLSYGKFHGTIPEGQYGAGKVKIYDKGTYELLDREGDKKYVIDFKGNKLNGIYALVKYNKGYLWVKTKKKDASLIDYPRPTMSISVWDIEKDPPTLRPKVKESVFEILDKASEKMGLKTKEWVKELYLCGSTTSYFYSEDSDIDINVKIDTVRLREIKEFEKFTGEILFDKIQTLLNRIKLKNNPYSFSFMILADSSRPISDGIYDLLGNKWIRGPFKLPENFDPDKAFIKARLIAYEICNEVDSLRGEIYQTVKDLEIIDQFRKYHGGLNHRKIIFMHRLQILCEEIDKLFEFIWSLPRKSLTTPNPVYPSLKIGPNWELNNLVFKYLDRYKYTNIIIDVYRHLKNNPYLKLIDKFIPD